MTDLPARIGSYRITRKLGEGGMGVVYAAVDEKLNRPVAVKTIRAAGSDPATRERFWREARAAASVNHPNVCQLYEIAEDAGELFLVMELLDGRPLSEQLQAGPLTPHDALSTLLPVLAALEALHGRGVVHRDLKPSNVFVTGHGIKLLDFGLARSVADDMAATTADLTVAGQVVGTPAYMAPEQLDESRVDARADLFAAGVLLFEMVAGRSPFAAASMMASMHAVLYERPPVLTGSASVEAVDRVVRRALEKKPADRYQSAAQMAAAVRAADGPNDSGEMARAVAVTRLVVLPFRVVPPDLDTDFLAVGLADALTASLSGLDSMVVRSPLAAGSFAGPAPDLKAIATTLDVDAVLTATLMRAGDQLRVSAQLVEAPAGTVQWSHRSQTGLGDLFALQDELTRQIVESLSVPLSRSEEQALKRDVPGSALAYEFYLRATQYGQTSETQELARDLYLQCLDEDPGYAPAWARLGRIYRRIGGWGDEAQSADYFEKAEAAFSRALELSPDLSLAHHLYAYLELDLGRAEEAMLRLLERAKRHRADPELLAGLVHALRYCGLLDASVAAFEKAKRLDPNVVTSVCQTFWMLGDIRRAVETERQEDRMMGLLAALRENRTAPVIEEMTRRTAKAHGAELDMARAFLAMLEGDREALTAPFDRTTANTRDPENLYYMSLMAAHVGDDERTLAMLERAVAGGWFCHATIARETWLEAVRDTPRFVAALAQAEAGHRHAAAAFLEAGGDRFLGLS
ncbi:MAG: protein kinase [Vicinamibacterales bacterium]|jgi:TolB-like protein/predicted Ser/Thr protein kinase|nr:protein kinase [Vicinamibacterales bacterium]